jgi:hypothetical protein
MFGIKMPWTKRKEEAERKLNEAADRRAIERESMRSLIRNQNNYLYAINSNQRSSITPAIPVTQNQGGMSLTDMILMQSMLSHSSLSVTTPEPEQSFVAGGGSFGGGGASGDWTSPSPSSSCDSGSSSSDSSSSYSSDSSSSCSSDSSSF